MDFDFLSWKKCVGDDALMWNMMPKVLLMEIQGLVCK